MRYAADTPVDAGRWTRFHGLLKHGQYLVDCDGIRLLPREDLVRTWAAHFDWGGRSTFGQYQLAVAILARSRGDEFARRHYRRFAEEILAGLDPMCWTLFEERLVAFERALEDGWAEARPTDAFVESRTRPETHA